MEERGEKGIGWEEEGMEEGEGENEGKRGERKKDRKWKGIREEERGEGESLMEEWGGGVGRESIEKK